MSEFDYWSRVFELLAHIVTVAGVPGAICVFIYEKYRDRRDRKERAFDELDKAYVEFTKLCLEHPYLDLFPSPASPPPDLSEEQRRKQEAIIAILISLCERVFLTYGGQGEPLKPQQWAGWITFMKSFAGRDNFRLVWRQIGNQFDEGFRQFVTTELNVQ